MGVILFKDCVGDHKFRFDLKVVNPNVGDVFSIDGIYFNGFASVIEYAEIGDVFDSDGTLFIQQRDCPEVIEEVVEPEVIEEVVEPEVIEEIQEVFVHEIIEEVVEPEVIEEVEEVVEPEVIEEAEEVVEPDVVEVFQNPFNPGVSPGDAIQNFCVSPQYNTLNSNVGNYSVASVLYDDHVYYTGQTSGVIYFNTDLEQWCLSGSLGGSCLLTGKSPCYGELNPDLYEGIVFSGACPTPTPSPASCDIIDFSAYFNCELSPTLSPTPTITPTRTITPTQTITPSSTGGLAINVGMSAYTYNYPSVSVSPTPSITPTNNIIISGDVTYNVVDNTFAFSGTRLLTECSTGVIYYAYQDLIFSGIPVNIGQSIRAVVNGEQRCFEYTSNITTVSSSSIYLDQILAVSANCSSCLITPTPTPTASLTPTQTQSYQTSLSVNSVIKDIDDNCWVYLGLYSNTYIPPTNVNPITYTGNYFASYTSSSFVDCQVCLVSLNLS